MISASTHICTTTDEKGLNGSQEDIRSLLECVKHYDENATPSLSIFYNCIRCFVFGFLFCRVTYYTSPLVQLNTPPTFPFYSCFLCIKMNQEKETIQHLEERHHDHHDELHAHGFALESEELPRGYFISPSFIGTFVAIGMNLASSTAGFALVAPVLGQIDVALGPSASITWLAYVYTICLAIGLLLVGRLSDLFGRRYFFVVGTALGVLGAIIGATAKTIPVLIGGQTLIGLSACTGYSYAFVLGEIVPIKYRFLANAVVFAFSLPTAGFGAAVSEAFILYTTPGWRWVYYLLIILNGLACVLYAAFYFPPTFEEKHDGRVLEWVKNFDYVGMVCT
jgi:hypothetical protein